MAKSKKAADLPVVTNVRTVFTFSIAQPFKTGRLRNLRIPYLINWLPIMLAVVGGTAPMLSHTIATVLHPLAKADNSLGSSTMWSDPMFYIWTSALIGLLAFSASTVFQWLNEAWRSPTKAAGVVVGVELVMVFGHTETPVVSMIALGMLVAINWIATACQMSLDAKLPVPRKNRKTAKTTKIGKVQHSGIPANSQKAA